MHRILHVNTKTAIHDGCSPPFYSTASIHIVQPQFEDQCNAMQAWLVHSSHTRHCGMLFVRDADDFVADAWVVDSDR